MNPSDTIKLYNNIGIISKIFLYLRFAIAPFDEVITRLPDKGLILDVGCGYGLLTNTISLTKPNVDIFGIDIDDNRITYADDSIGTRKNIKFKVSDVTKDKLPSGRFDVIIIFDLLHHVPFSSQEKIINQCHRMLVKDGILIIKEINNIPRWKFIWNYFHDKIITKGDSLFFRTQEEWINLLNNSGYEIESIQYPKKGFFYPHLLIYAKKNGSG